MTKGQRSICLSCPPLSWAPSLLLLLILRYSLAKPTPAVTGQLKGPKAPGSPETTERRLVILLEMDWQTGLPFLASSCSDTHIGRYARQKPLPGSVFLGNLPITSVPQFLHPAPWLQPRGERPEPAALGWTTPDSSTRGRWGTVCCFEALHCGVICYIKIDISLLRKIKRNREIKFLLTVLSVL